MDDFFEIDIKQEPIDGPTFSECDSVLHKPLGAEFCDRRNGECDDQIEVKQEIMCSDLEGIEEAELMCIQVNQQPKAMYTEVKHEVDSPLELYVNDISEIGQSAGVYIDDNKCKIEPSYEGDHNYNKHTDDVNVDTIDEDFTAIKHETSDNKWFDGLAVNNIPPKSQTYVDIVEKGDNNNEDNQDMEFEVDGEVIRVTKAETHDSDCKYEWSSDNQDMPYPDTVHSISLNHPPCNKQLDINTVKRDPTDMHSSYYIYTDKMNSRRYGCFKCLYTTSELTQFKTHIKTHGNDAGTSTAQLLSKPYDCKHCDSFFSKKGLLLTHIKDIHKEFIVCKFDNCLMTFTKKRNFSTHVKDVHKKFFVCKFDNCLLTFTKKKSLLKHQKSHFFTCGHGHCNRRFRQWKTWKKHVQRLHGVLNYKPNSSGLATDNHQTHSHNRATTNQTHSHNRATTNQTHSHNRATTNHQTYSGNRATTNHQTYSENRATTNHQTYSENRDTDNHQTPLDKRATIKLIRITCDEGYPKLKSYLCMECSYLTFNIVEFTNHLKYHDDEEDIYCTICRTNFLVQNIAIHMNSHKTVDDNVKSKHFACKYCTANFSRHNAYLAHRKTHLQYRTCEKCLKRFVNNHSFLKHIKRCTSLITYVCNKCFACFSDNQQLPAHTRIHMHCPFPCHYCKGRFMYQTTWLKHMKIAHHEKLSTTSFNIRETNTYEHLYDTHYHDSQYYINTRRKLVANYKVNKESLDSSNQYMCDECGDIFSQSSYLSKHKICHDNGHVEVKAEPQDTPYICCVVCSYKTYNVDDFATHVKGHADIREAYHCSICGLHFSLKVYINHMKIHPSMNPYHCIWCDETFSTASGLKSHKIMHWDWDKSFKHSHRLITSYIDQAVKCDKCGVAFANKTNILQHICNDNKIANLSITPDSTKVPTVSQIAPDNVSIDDRLTCDCGLSFTSKHTFRIHKQLKCLFSKTAVPQNVLGTNVPANVLGNNVPPNMLGTNVPPNMLGTNVPPNVLDNNVSSHELKNNVMLSKIYPKSCIDQSTPIQTPAKCEHCGNKYRIDEIHYCQKKISGPKRSTIKTLKRYYACYQCEYKARNMTDLTKHQRSHNINGARRGAAGRRKSDTSFYCRLCMKSFDTYSAATTHVLRHMHNITKRLQVNLVRIDDHLR